MEIHRNELRKDHHTGCLREVWDFNEGLAAVADADHKVGFIDRTNELKIPMMDVDWEDVC